MSWIGITTLIALSGVTIGIAYLMLVRHRKKSRGRRSPHHVPTIEEPEVEDSVLQAGATTAHTEEAPELADSHPRMATSGTPPTSSYQTSEIPDSVETIAPESQPVRPADPSTEEGQSDITSGPPPEACGIKSEQVLQLDKAHEKSKSEEGLPVAHPSDSDLKTYVGGPTSSAEDVKLPAKEPEPTRDGIDNQEPAESRFETGDFTDCDANAPTPRADDTEKKTPGGEETAYGTAEEDVQTQPSEAHTERDADRLVSKPDASRQTNEIVHRAEPPKGQTEDLSDVGRGAKEKEEQRETASKKTGERQPRKPTGATTPADVRLTRDRSTAGGEGKSDGVTEQIAAAPRTEMPQQKARMAKRKRKRRQLPTRARTEVESEEDRRLLAEVPEIPERLKVGEDTEFNRIRRLRRPSRYRPPSQEPLVAPQPSAKRRPARRAPQKSFALTVRLLFERSGHIRVGLLPQREADLPEDIVLGQAENRYTVTAVHDAWYEDVFPENLAELLGVGIAWEGCAESEVIGYWRLSGRDLYVLATHNDLHGFAQTTRLKIGREHVILCKNSLLLEVEPILQQAGCAGFIKLDDSYGALNEWTVIRGVVPTNIVRVENGPEILSILQPEPELEIDLLGGIYLHQSTWLSGFPPRICVFGDMGTETEVFIDGGKAVAGDNGSFRNQNYDTVGEHRVSIPLANMSRTYRISENDEGWTPWDAYSMAHTHLCGPLLLALDTSDTPRVVVVPSCNSVILGPQPGDIAWCPQILGPKQVGWVSFHPVWALPRDAFGCDKRTTRILLLDARRLAQAQHHQFTGKDAARVLAWSTAILDASREGLSLDSSDVHAAVLWREYNAHARSLWKALTR